MCVIGVHIISSSLHASQYIKYDFPYFSHKSIVSQSSKVIWLIWLVLVHSHTSTLIFLISDITKLLLDIYHFIIVILELCWGKIQWIKKKYNLMKHKVELTYFKTASLEIFTSKSQWENLVKGKNSTHNVQFSFKSFSLI